MIKNNYHTHLIFCNHAVGYSVDYVREAISLGFDEIGITDHAPIPEYLMTPEEYEINLCDENMKLDTVTTYLLDVKNAQAMFKDKIKVLVGFEIEYLPWGKKLCEELRSYSDYLNVGIHFFHKDKKIYNTYTDLNEETLEYYVDNCIEAMETGLFNTLVHPDLFMYSYKNKNGERVFDDNCVRASHRIIESAIKNNVYLEVNANGVKYAKDINDYDSWLYPFHKFWEIAREYKDLKIIIGADAHDPKNLGNENVEAACKFAADMKLNVLERMEINH